MKKETAARFGAAAWHIKVVCPTVDISAVALDYTVDLQRAERLLETVNKPVIHIDEDINGAALMDLTAQRAFPGFDGELRAPV